LCDFSSAFIPKGQVGRHSRAIARNGLILLMSSFAGEPLDGALAEMRLRTWNRCILPGSAPEPYGILMVIRPAVRGRFPALRESFRQTIFAPTGAAGSPLSLELGGNKYLSILEQGSLP
jgi:hypothetical protein